MPLRSTRTPARCSPCAPRFPHPIRDGSKSTPTISFFALTRNMCVREKKARLAWPLSAIRVTIVLRGAYSLERTYVDPATCSVPEGPHFPRPWMWGVTPTWRTLSTAVLVILGA